MTGAVWSAKPSLSSVDAESNAQMAMFDELGPKARLAIADCLRNPNLRALKSAFKQKWVNDWLESHGYDSVPPPKSFADLDDELAAFIIDKTRVLCPITGKPLPCLEPRKLKRVPPSRFRLRSPSSTAESR